MRFFQRRELISLIKPVFNYAQTFFLYQMDVIKWNISKEVFIENVWRFSLSFLGWWVFRKVKYGLSLFVILLFYFDFSFSLFFNLNDGKYFPSIFFSSAKFLNDKIDLIILLGAKGKKCSMGPKKMVRRQQTLNVNHGLFDSFMGSNKKMFYCKLFWSQKMYHSLSITLEHFFLHNNRQRREFRAKKSFRKNTCILWEGLGARNFKKCTFDKNMLANVSKSDFF